MSEKYLDIIQEVCEIYGIDPESFLKTRNDSKELRHCNKIINGSCTLQDAYQLYINQR